MASGLGIVSDGVTITLAPDADGAVSIALSAKDSHVKATEGAALLDDPKALATVVDGMYADLLAAEHQSH